MNALPAEALTCDSDSYPPHAGTGRHEGAEIRPLRPPRPAAPRPDTRHPAAPSPRDTPAAPSPRALRPAGPRPGEVPAAPLRLTRRGKVVAAIAAALLVSMISLLAAAAAQATNHGPSARVARQDLVQVVVRPGQSLWSVAESTDPDQDTRAVIQQIVDLNGLSSDVVFAGQQLWVPRG
jgi:LysM repeat protein